MMSKTDALIYAADGIRVNSVHPGFIWTPLVEQHLRDLKQDQWEKNTGLTARSNKVLVTPPKTYSRSLRCP